MSARLAWQSALDKRDGTWRRWAARDLPPVRLQNPLLRRDWQFKDPSAPAHLLSRPTHSSPFRSQFQSPQGLVSHPVTLSRAHPPLPHLLDSAIAWDSGTVPSGVLISSRNAPAILAEDTVAAVRLA